MLVPKYGVNIDRMKPHYVKVEGRPILEQWVKENLPDENISVLYVTPTPWIRGGLQRGRNKIKRRLERGDITKAIKKRR